MIDMTSCMTVPPAKYDIKKLSEIVKGMPKAVRVRAFLDLAVEQKHVLYDWGLHHFYIFTVPFTVKNHAAWTLDGVEIDLEERKNWMDMSVDELDEVARGTLLGEWGPSAVDTISRMERSGITVEICGSPKIGPKAEDRKSFMEDLRKNLKG